MLCAEMREPILYQAKHHSSNPDYLILVINSVKATVHTLTAYDTRYAHDYCAQNLATILVETK